MHIFKKELFNVFCLIHAHYEPQVVETESSFASFWLKNHLTTSGVATNIKDS